MKRDEIQIRDPFVVPDERERRYYLFGTTDRDCWKGPGQGFDCYCSTDLAEWDGPIPVFRPLPSFWGTSNFWAPEVHGYQARYWMFASFRAPHRYRGTQILVADQLAGPYAPWTAGPVTPAHWQCLDGTLHVAADGQPWIVFCHEWVQIHNGSICAQRLSADLKQALGRPVLLFHASDAAWVHRPEWPSPAAPYRFPTYVTDGPFLFRTRTGTLLMLWSSLGAEGYAMGVARSETGTVTGPWTQEPVPIWSADGGHGMVFRTFDGRLFLTFHAPNRTPDERPVFVEVEDLGTGIRCRC